MHSRCQDPGIFTKIPHRNSDKIWDFWPKFLRTVWVKFEIFWRNATPKNLDKIWTQQSLPDLSSDKNWCTMGVRTLAILQSYIHETKLPAVRQDNFNNLSFIGYSYCQWSYWLSSTNSSPDFDTLTGHWQHHCHLPLTSWSHMQRDSDVEECDDDWKCRWVDFKELATF